IARPAGVSGTGTAGFASGQAIPKSVFVCAYVSVGLCCETFGRNGGSMRKCWLVVAAAFMLGATLAIAQSVTGTITGTVKDPAGAVVTHAKVVARNADTNAETTTTTNEFGQYKFANLLSGEYTVAVETSGFRKSVLSPQRLAVNDVLREDITLEVGAVTEMLTVEAN